MLTLGLDWPRNKSESEMVEKRVSTYQVDQVNYMSNKLGLHKVGNQSQTPAISLHLYSPPILQCQTFCKSTGTARASGRCLMYSRYGRIVDNIPVVPDDRQFSIENYESNTIPRTAHLLEPIVASDEAVAAILDQKPLPGRRVKQHFSFPG